LLFFYFSFSLTLFFSFSLSLFALLSLFCFFSLLFYLTFTGGQAGLGMQGTMALRNSAIRARVGLVIRNLLTVHQYIPPLPLPSPSILSPSIPLPLPLPFSLLTVTQSECAQTQGCTRSCQRCSSTTQAAICYANLTTCECVDVGGICISPLFPFSPPSLPFPFPPYFFLIFSYFYLKFCF